MKNEYPVYLKYDHERTYFKINSKENFDELNIIGSYYIYRNQQAQIFPEFAMIIDMLENLENKWTAISAIEFDEKLRYCQENLKERKF
jgi:hypothetical protein